MVAVPLSVNGLAERGLWGLLLLLGCVLSAQTRDLPPSPSSTVQDSNPGLAMGPPSWPRALQRSDTEACSKVAMDTVMEERGWRVEALPPGSAHHQRSSLPRRPPSLGGAPVGPGHVGTSLRTNTSDFSGKQ